jgi:YhgE/Pip-like protein
LSTPESAATSDRSAASRRDSYPVRPRQILRVPPVWAVPILLGAVVVGLITAFYISSVVDPLAHLRGLPVVVVNEDSGATAGAQQVNIGGQVRTALVASRAVSGRLKIMVSDLSGAETTMNSDNAYATVVIPPNFTRSLLTVSGLAAPGSVSERPGIEILANQRAGTLGVSLATGVLQPALRAISHDIGRRFLALAPAAALTPALRALLADPIAVTIIQFRPLPSHSALGLSAFYIALLTLMCGFLGGTIVDSGVDGATGYATTEMGPRWSQRQPLPINRWRTLLIKWAVAAVVTAVASAVVLAVATGGLGMNTPDPALLWSFMWLCSASVAAGTIVLFAVLGTPGQLVAILVFVYIGLASAGGTVPVQALPGFLRDISPADPLREILDGTRSILYFNSQSNAGLARGALAAAIGLVFWIVVGTAVVRWYDRRGLERMSPELLAYINAAVQGFRSDHPGGSAEDAAATPSAAQAAEQIPTQPNE